jgi:hypothetical protein
MKDSIHAVTITGIGTEAPRPYRPEANDHGCRGLTARRTSWRHELACQCENSACLTRKFSGERRFVRQRLQGRQIGLCRKLDFCGSGGIE